MKKGLEQLNDSSMVLDAAGRTRCKQHFNKSTQKILTVGKEYGGEAGPRGIEAAGVVHLSTPYTAGKRPIVDLQISYSERRSRQGYIGE